MIGGTSQAEMRALSQQFHNTHFKYLSQDGLARRIDAALRGAGVPSPGPSANADVVAGHYCMQMCRLWARCSTV